MGRSSGFIPLLEAGGVGVLGWRFFGVGDFFFFFLVVVVSLWFLSLSFRKEMKDISRFVGA